MSDVNSPLEPPTRSHFGGARGAAFVKCAERLIVVIEKGIGNRASIFVNHEREVCLLGEHLERAVLHPHVIVPEVLEHDAKNHVLVVRQPGKSG